MKQDKVLVACPKCGHSQPEPRAVYSTLCKRCGQHFRLQEVLRPVPKAPELRPHLRHITCFKCGTVLEVAPAAQSTMCKRCSSHVDLRDYTIANSISKNFKTKGRLVIQEGGFLFNTETTAGDVILRGRFLGKLIAEGSFEIHPGAEFKGGFTAGRLVIPLETRFRWTETIPLHGADISGELVANLVADGAVVLRATARLFGNVQAKDLVVEGGAVWVGQACVGLEKPPLLGG
jgi:cytoskeletal protein CcmA (bactofilin family)/DNA-directed RNA polymerase subunit RPC12/RpoP